MHNLKHVIVAFSMLMISCVVLAAPTFVEGKDYRVIPPTPLAPALSPGKVHVTEFFSYGCPWCYRLEPTLEKWIATKPKGVVFERVPVVFESNWEVYAKVYYIAQAFRVEDKVAPAIFSALHNEGKQLTLTDFADLFSQKAKITKETFIAAFNSPTIDVRVRQGKALMGLLKVYGVPSFVVNNRYRTDMALAKGDSDRLVAITQFLVKKAQKEVIRR